MKHNSSQKKYDAGNMGDAHSLAKDDLWWMVTALDHVKKEVRRLAVEADAKGYAAIYFDNLLDHLSMYEYLAQDRHDSHERSAEEYFAEWEKDKANTSIKAVA